MGWNLQGPNLKIQPLVDATLRHLKFRIDRPEVKHRRLEVRVHENNFRNYTLALGYGLLELMGEPRRVLDTPSDAWSVVVQFNQKYGTDFNYLQQVYLTTEHNYVEYESDDQVSMIFDCTQQLKGEYR